MNEYRNCFLNSQLAVKQVFVNVPAFNILEDNTSSNLVLEQTHS